MYGIIGYGTVGKAIGNALHPKAAYWVHDTAPSLKSEVSDFCIKETTGVFICVPTPSSEGQGYDLTHIKSALRWLKYRKYTGVVVLHSTINYTDWAEITACTKLRVAYSPEYLRAKYANTDWLEANVVQYGPWTNPGTDKLFRAALAIARGPSVELVRKPVAELCITKTGTNLALTLKLLSANLTYMECMEAGLTHKAAQAIVDSVFTDPRLETSSPYHKCAEDGWLGAGGACLPKDLAAKIPLHTARHSSRGNVMWALNEFNDQLRSLRKQGT